MCIWVCVGAHVSCLHVCASGYVLATCHDLGVGACGRVLAHVSCLDVCACECVLAHVSWLGCGAHRPLPETSSLLLCDFRGLNLGHYI